MKCEIQVRPWLSALHLDFLLKDNEISCLYSQSFFAQCYSSGRPWAGSKFGSYLLSLFFMLIHSTFSFLSWSLVYTYPWLGNCVKEFPFRWSHLITKPTPSESLFSATFWSFNFASWERNGMNVLYSIPSHHKEMCLFDENLCYSMQSAHRILQNGVIWYRIDTKFSYRIAKFMSITSLLSDFYVGE